MATTQRTTSECHDAGRLHETDDRAVVYVLVLGGVDVKYRAQLLGEMYPVRRNIERVQVATLRGVVWIRYLIDTRGFVHWHPWQLILDRRYVYGVFQQMIGYSLSRSLVELVCPCEQVGMIIT